MNEHEVSEFSEELIISFPAFKAVAEKHSPDFDRTRRAWGMAWCDLAISECRDALRRLLVDGGISYENLQQPGPFVRNLVLEARKAGAQSERDTATAIDRERALARRRDYKGSPMAAALANAIEMQQSGSSEDEIFASIDAAFPEAAEYESPTYRCLLCYDQGLVQVVRMDTMRKVQLLDLPAECVTRTMTYMVACNCGASRSVRDRKPMRQSGNLPIYDPRNLCDFKDDGHDYQRIIDWLANRKPKNYERCFENHDKPTIARP